MKEKIYSNADLFLERAMVADIEGGSGAEPSNRQHSCEADTIVWEASGWVDDVPVTAIYVTTKEDRLDVEEAGGDWGIVDWPNRLYSVQIDIVRCDQDDVQDEQIDAVIARLG